MTRKSIIFIIEVISIKCSYDKNLPKTHFVSVYNVFSTFIRSSMIEFPSKIKNNRSEGIIFGLGTSLVLGQPWLPWHPIRSPSLARGNSLAKSKK